MHTTLSPTQIEEVRQALLGSGSDALIDLIFRLNLSLPLNSNATAAIEAAERLGWVTQGQGLHLSSLGWLVADPLREYRLWLDRDRRIHGERDYALLAPERYTDKMVLEVGSGFGCNLLSLGMRTQGTFVGIEPMAIYRQFTSLLAEREGAKVASNLLNGARTMITTLSYQWLGRRIWQPSSAFATATPIYPSRNAMYRWIAEAGLKLRDDLTGDVGHETCFVADKPALSTPSAHFPHQVH